ncbi:uncharacterized protein LOC115423132 [Sphaeramia orbicularis]|uniref:uncharacterized protein LOC115423132 n=1 Tax=Sphaeramia orbicularis TaxID=375764 RepID=UPI00117CA72D|nr:uncharacterized protein LOC115423132 [Sphaeramia orbicularis]
MDLFNDLEIFIPLEAEVKSVPLHSLPKSVLRRISISVSDHQGSRMLADSHHCIWICPAVIRHEGQKAVTQTLNSVKENMTSLLGASCLNPVYVPFVSANHTAYEVLKETMPGTKVSHTQQTCLIPHGSPLRTHQVALVIYNRRIFLSIKKSGKKQETHHPQTAAESSPPSTPAQSHVKKIQEDVTNQRSQPETTVQRKRQHTDTLLREPELQRNKTSICKRAVNENKEDVCDKGGDASASKAVQSIPHPPDSIHTVDKLQGQANLKLAGFQSGRDQEQNEDKEPEKHCDDRDMCELPNQSKDNMNTYLHLNDYDQSEDQSWSRGESTFLSQEVDFQALEQDEIIARMEARLRQREAALHNLHTPK